MNSSFFIIAEKNYAVLYSSIIEHHDKEEVSVGPRERVRLADDYEKMKTVRARSTSAKPGQCV